MRLFVTAGLESKKCPSSNISGKTIGMQAQYFQL